MKTRMTTRQQLTQSALAALATIATMTALAAASGAHAQDMATQAETMSAQDEALSAQLDPTPQILDTTSMTDDHSVNVPTGWWTYTNVSAASIGTYLSQNNARLTEVKVYGVSNGTPTFSVRMVANSGAYAVPGWWWYYGLTAADVTAKVNANTARLIDLQPYDAGGGTIRYAAVMVSNTGSAARAWSYLMGVSTSQISTQITNSGHRLIDLDSYVEGGVKKYSAVFVANTGADAKSWQWFYGVSPATIASKVSAFQGRIVKLDRHSDGTYNMIQVKNTGSDASAWWYQYGFASMADLNNYALQLASRPVDITTYKDANGTRRYDAAFIDNANTSTRRMRSEFAPTFLDANGNPTKGIFEAYLKEVSGSVKVDLNGSRRAETASSFKSVHLLHSMRQVAAGADTLASAFSYYEYDPVKGKDACPNPALETAANLRTNYNFETGLDQMMAISDNRTTRGTVIRYGGFTPFNNTAAAVGLTGTTLRHNIGCGYKNLSTGKYDPTNMRNDTTASNLARIYEGVWNSTLLSNNFNARTEFLESANPSSGVDATLQAVINEEAAALGKSSIAASFGANIKRWGKGGSYGTCLPDSNGACGQKVTIRSGTGLISLPFKSGGVIAPKVYSFARLISDVPVSCWNCAEETTYVNAYNDASNELYRDEIRAALKTW